jgi:UDP-glucose 4-epimerase
LNYDKYFIEGEENIASFEDYHSHNTKVLDVDEMAKLLLKLDIVTDDVRKTV